MNNGIAVKRVGEVVDRVRQQCHRARRPDDEHLDQRGDHERGERDLHGPQAPLAGFQGGVHAVGGIVAVRPEDLTDHAAKPSVVEVAMTLVRGAMVVVVVAHDARRSRLAW